MFSYKKQSCIFQTWSVLSCDTPVLLTCELELPPLSSCFIPSVVLSCSSILIILCFSPSRMQPPPPPVLLYPRPPIISSSTTPSINRALALTTLTRQSFPRSPIDPLPPSAGICHKKLPLSFSSYSLTSCSFLKPLRQSKKKKKEEEDEEGILQGGV